MLLDSKIKHYQNENRSKIIQVLNLWGQFQTSF